MPFSSWEESSAVKASTQCMQAQRGAQGGVAPRVAVSNKRRDLADVQLSGGIRAWMQRCERKLSLHWRILRGSSCLQRPATAAPHMIYYCFPVRVATAAQQHSRDRPTLCSPARQRRRSAPLIATTENRHNGSSRSCFRQLASAVSTHSPSAPKETW